MKRFLLVLLSGLVCGGYPATVYAQYPGPGNPYTQRPVVSPYVNLLRKDASPGVLYQGVVRPQLDFYKFREQQTAINQQVQAEAAQLTQPQEGATGHTSYFQNYSHYYPSSAGQGGRTGQQQQRQPARSTPPSRGARSGGGVGGASGIRGSR